ncbi:MAG: phosphate ABC transporter permease PstA, partial [Armatimonadetes bacterium]|nr:phosphate ABC transporter permease PstA [Armatimonadota bacterium]
LIFALIGFILYKGLPAISWSFLSQPPVEGMSAGGIWPMIRGSLILMGGCLAFSLPIGVLGGVFFAEYGTTNRFIGFIRACVSALAGTPSIVYALFGYAVFCILLKLNPSVWAGWLTLSMMCTPIVVLMTEQAIKAVPETTYEAAVAIGLTRAQTLGKVILPAATPGIATGLVLATGRTAGEATPIILTVGAFYKTGNFEWNANMLRETIMNLPYHLFEGYRQGGKIPETIIWGTCLILMGLVLIINLFSILIRSKYRKKLAS